MATTTMRTTEQKQADSTILETTNWYTVCAKTVDDYYKAKRDDYYPNQRTQEILGIQDSSEAGRDLYGAFNTLFLHGRCSLTMMENALIHSETSYPEQVELWIRSLPPKERSMYAASLYNSGDRFTNGIPWDHEFYQRMARHLREEFPDVQLPHLPQPLGDDRHSPVRHQIQTAVYDFHATIDCGIFFSGSLVDFHRPLSLSYNEYAESDILVDFGPVFGVHKSHLTFGERSDNGRDLSVSEQILRCWNVMYFSNRLCKTELEYALLNGPTGIKTLLLRGLTLLSLFHAQDLATMMPMMTALSQILSSAEAQDLFQELPTSQTRLMECDYCGEQISMEKKCGNCSKAVYCHRNCQKGDWKRHKWLCNRYYCRQANN
jgi:MYND finger